MVNFLLGGKVTFTSWKWLATQYQIDGSGNLIELNPWYLLSGYGGNTANTGGAWQRYRFSDLRNTKPDFTSCSLTDGYVWCTNSEGPAYAGTCNNDGYLYFGSPSQIPDGCGWIGLYPTN